MIEYIDRNAAILSIGKLYTRNEIAFNDEEGQAYNDGIQEAANALNDVSAADVAPVVHGHWIKTGDADERYNSRGYFFFRCSCCGFGLGGQTVEKEKYCCNCGAKMDEQQKTGAAYTVPATGK